jgi:hypothetical protein
MAQLKSKFTEFLEAIEPDRAAVRHAKAAHEPLREHLQQDPQFGSHVLNTFLYGSYQRDTAIDDIKDVDIVVLTDFNNSKPENTPQNVLRQLKAAINRHYNDGDNQQYQRRSIRVDDPLPDNPSVKTTLDVIPAFAQNGEDEPLFVPDRELGQWIYSHPKGHIKYTEQLNNEQNGKGRFVPLVKIMKSWWKYQCVLRQPKVTRPKPKGFWVEIMTGQFFDVSKLDYADHFIVVLESALTSFKATPGVPQLQDPGLNGNTIKTSMAKEEFAIFLQAMEESLETARRAYAEPNELASSVLWQKIFGNKFPLADDESDISKDIPPPSTPGPKTPPMPPRRREVG